MIHLREKCDGEQQRCRGHRGIHRNWLGNDKGPYFKGFCACQNQRNLTLDFDNRDRFEMHHYAFHVSDAEFDAIFGRIKEGGIPYGSGPFSQDDMKTNTWNGGRGVYFKDPNGHVLELLTRA